MAAGIVTIIRTITWADSGWRSQRRPMPWLTRFRSMSARFWRSPTTNGQHSQTAEVFQILADDGSRMERRQRVDRVDLETTSGACDATGSSRARREANDSFAATG